MINIEITKNRIIKYDNKPIFPIFREKLPGFHKAIKAKTIIEMLSDAVIQVFLATDPRNDLFLQYASNTTTMSKLNILLPKTSPAAKSGASSLDTAFIPVPSSGSEVAVANKTTPIKDLPNPVFVAILSADFAKYFDVNKITEAAIINCIHGK